jgi:MoxR-like ATPase
MTLSKKQAYQLIKNLKHEICKAFVGNEDAIEYLIIGLLTGLHVLIEDRPGVGKTTLAKSLAKSASLDFARIQFTPDLMPGDITGMTVWSIEKKDFIFKEGAIMHQLILADEINRANSRTQSSLLEAMQEQSVTVDGRTYPLPNPFFVVATQNPVSFSGTFMLPEAQVDRFGISFTIGYPNEIDEIKILDRYRRDNPFDEIKPVVDGDQIISMKKMVTDIHVDEKIKNYIVKIANQSRLSKKIRLGISPRASQHLQKAAQAKAFMSGREYVIPEDIIKMSLIVLPHRIILSGEAKLEDITPEIIISDLVKNIRVPIGLKYPDEKNKN